MQRIEAQTGKGCTAGENLHHVRQGTRLHDEAVFNAMATVLTGLRTLMTPKKRKAIQIRPQLQRSR